MNKSLQSHLNETSIPKNLCTLFSALESAGKQIRLLVLTAGLQDVYGNAGTTNIQGETVQKLDLLSNDILKKELFNTNVVSVIASEEYDTITQPQTPPTNSLHYAVLIDPLDGSSNIDVNISVGTIFAIYDATNLSPEAACLQPGNKQIASGYILYGTSTIFVLTTGNGVFGFTYDPEKNDFLMSHPNIRIPSKETYYSINEGNMNQLLPDTLAFIQHAKSEKISARYVGSLVADFHRNLLKGGIYLYPGLQKKPDGKLRLLYEGNPLALICEQAGGSATNGTTPILEVPPKDLHQRTPLFIGNTSLVKHLNG